MSLYGAPLYNEVEYNSQQLPQNLTVTLVENMTLHAMPAMYDVVFVSANGQISVSNKGLSDTIRVADWLTIDRTPFQVDWTNQGD